MALARECGQTIDHLGNTRKRRGFSGLRIAASCGGRLFPQPVRVGTGPDGRVCQRPSGQFAEDAGGVTEGVGTDADAVEDAEPEHGDFPIGKEWAAHYRKRVLFPDRDFLWYFALKSLCNFPIGKDMKSRFMNPVAVGAIVRSTRKALRMRQDELAGAAGVGVRFIVELEAGKPGAHLGKTLQVLSALGCSIEITPPADPSGGSRL